ncbi:MAG TPA: transposase domain-containing protein, partial [Armatimonadota bacterium]|nr:transposase domain-containing protein [Armatimonadota bacterium]
MSSSSRALPHVTGKFSLALLPQVIPPDTVAQVLADTGHTSHRRRALPMDFLVYYLIALAFFMPESCREVLRLVQEDLRHVVARAVRPDVAGKSAITQARTKLGPTVLQTLYERLAA